jgi:hypothetical protein
LGAILKAKDIIRASSLFILLCARSPALGAEPADVADLFPPGTLAYAELTDPAKLSLEVAAVFKGTVLEDSIPFIHKRKDAATTLMELNGKREIAGLGLLASPEMMSEFKKLRGVAVGLTGFSKSGDPEAALVVMTGDSAAAGLAARAYLTMTSSLRKVGEVSKVAIFQHRLPSINYDMNGIPMVANDKPPMEIPHELTMAYTPGLFVAGTSKDAVSYSIKRFRGEEKSSLSEIPLFKQAAAIHRQPGLFYFVNFPDFATKLDAMNKLRGGMAEPDAFAWFKLLANARAVQVIAGNVHFREGGLHATLTASFDPSKKSPLMEFLSSSGAKIELLHHAQRPAMLAFGVVLPEKNRALRTIGLLDSLAKANGELGRLPSDVVKDLEAKYKLSISEGLLGKTRAATVVLPSKQELPKGARRLPVLVLHTEDAATAGAWQEFFPKLIADLSGSTSIPQASTETIDGIKVFSLPGQGLPWNGPVHFALSGTTVAIGLDRKLVAGSVTPKAASESIAANIELATGAKPAAIIGVIAVTDVIPLLLENTRPDGPVVPVEDGPAFLPGGIPRPENLPENLTEEVAKSKKEFFNSLKAISPATIVVQSSGNELRIDLFQPKVQRGEWKTVIDSGANWLDKLGSVMGNFRQFENR